MTSLNHNNSFGMFIPNSNFNFKVEWIKNIEDFLFVNSTNEELIIYKREKEELSKKYILLSKCQKRDKILDVFIVDLLPNLIKIGKKVIITVSEKFILNFWNLKDGLCISQVNLSKHLLDKKPLIYLSIISNRFLVFFFKEYIVIFDSNTHLIIKQQKLEFTLTQVFHIKENKYFLYCDKSITYLFQFKEKETNDLLFTRKETGDGFSHPKKATNKIYTSIENLLSNSTLESTKYLRKGSTETQEINNSHTINPNPYLEKMQSFNFGHSDNDPEINFQYDKFFILIQKSNFLIQSLFQGEGGSPVLFSKGEFSTSNNIINNYLYNFNNDFSDTHFITFENGNYIFHTQNNTINVSFYNQFEEINVASTLPLESKFSVVFMNKFTAGKNIEEKSIAKNDTLLFVIYKDMSLVIYKFNTLINQLEKIHKIYLMVEDEYANMKFLMLKNLLIGHVDEYIFIFDFENLSFEKEEKYVDNTIELNNIFNKKTEPLNFTNYFKDNFKEKHKYYFDSIIKQSHNSQDLVLKTLKTKDLVSKDGKEEEENKEEMLSLSKNSSFNNSHKRHKEKKSFKVSASSILAEPDNASIYYIFGTDIGKIAIIDIFFDEALSLNPIFLLNYHTAKINFMMIIDQKYLIAASEDGVISITDICKSTIERAIERYKSESFRESVTKLRRESLTNSNPNESKETENPKINRIISHSKTFISRDSSKSIPLTKLSSKDSISSLARDENQNINEKLLNSSSYYFNSRRNYNFNGFFSRRKSFKNDENKAHITIDKILDIHDEDYLHCKSSENKKFINLLPILTMKNYFKLKKILPVNFIDLDTTNQDKQKFYYALILEDDSALVINMELMKIIYNFNVNFDKREIRGVYLKHNQNILMFYLGDGTLRICNYINKMGDRHITDPEIIYKILRVEDRLKSLFSDPNVASNFGNNNNNYNYNPSHQNINKDPLGNYISENFKALFDYEEFKKYCDEHSKKSLSNRNYYEMGKIAPGSYGNAYTNPSQSVKSSENIGMEYILGKLETEEEKTIFLQKYIFSIYSEKKLELNISQNKFDASLLKKVECFIIDKIYEIVNQTNLPQITRKNMTNNIFSNNNINNFSNNKNNSEENTNLFSNHIHLTSNNFEKVKKIEIFNLINNPNKYTKMNEKSNIKIQGVDTMLLAVGCQSLECLDFQIEEFIQYIDRKVEKSKNAQHIISQKINYLNFISLFRIWNLSVDQDSNILNFLKIFQPIFDFNFILKGENNSLTLLLNQESEIDSYLNEHFEFFKEYMQSNEDKKRVFKDDKYFDKKYLVNYQKGYLVNYKNFKVSTTVSHLMNLSYYSCMISILGFQESALISKLIVSEKNLMRNLSQKKYIKFTSFAWIDKFFFEEFDDVSLANKDLILFDFLCDKSSKKVLPKLTEMLAYLKYKHAYLFKDEQEANTHFYKLNKEKNIDPKKLNLLDKYDLFLINLVITYDSIFPEQLDKEEVLKATQLLVLLIFKFLKTEETRSKYSKIIVEMLSKSVGNMELIYKENMFNYAKFLIDLYTSIKVPIDLDGLFKKYDLDICTIIKSDSKFNFLKIMLAKQIKYFAKTKVNTIIYLIGEEFKKKNCEYNYYSHLLEILWLLLREKNAKYVQYLPLIVNLIVTNIAPQNKEMKNVCLEYSKKILANLISYYPMVAIDSQSQKLAVGANDGKIYIYDLSTGSFWKNLNAHQSEITALIFDNSGNIIISYSSTELNVKFWKIGLTNFLSNFFTSKNGYYQIKNIEPIAQHYDEKQKIDTVKFQSMPKGDNRILLIREDHSNVFMKI